MDMEEINGFTEEFIRSTKVILDENGIPYETEEDLDAIWSSIEHDYTEFQNKGKKLADKRRNILKKCGATDAQIDWGNYSNVRLTPMDAARLKDIDRRVKNLIKEYIPVIGYATFINEQREAIRQKKE